MLNKKEKEILQLAATMIKFMMVDPKISDKNFVYPEDYYFTPELIHKILTICCYPEWAFDLQMVDDVLSAINSLTTIQIDNNRTPTKYRLLCHFRQDHAELKI